MIATVAGSLPLPVAGDLPPELVAAPRWVAFALEERDGKLTKVPKSPHTGRNASSTNAATWADFTTARAFAGRHGLGVGFMLAPPFVGVDLDECRDAETGALTPLAVSILGGLPTYAEVSVSGTGVKAIAFGTKPGPRCRRNGLQLEVYGEKRLFALTGQRLPEAPLAIADCREGIDSLYHQAFGREEAPPLTPVPRGHPPTTADDAAVLDRARAAANGAKFSRLFDAGDWEGQGYGSHSEAREGLCSLLAFWCRDDPDQCERLYLASALYPERADKWPREREQVLRIAYDRREFYDWSHATPAPPAATLHAAPGPDDPDLLATYLALPHEELARRAVDLHRAVVAARAAAAEAQQFRRDAQGMLSNVMQIRRNKAIKTEAATLTATAIAYAAAEKDDEGYARMPLDSIADATGKGPEAVSTHLERGQDWGLLHKKLVAERQVNPDTGEVDLKKVTRVKLLATPAQTLEQLIVITPPRPIKKATGKAMLTWGGERQPCPECGSLRTRRETRVICGDCGHVSRPTARPAPVPSILPDTGREETWASIMGATPPGTPPAESPAKAPPPVSGILPPYSNSGVVAAPCDRQDAGHREALALASWDGTHACRDCGHACYALAGTVPRCLPCARGQPASLPAYGGDVAAGGDG